MENREVAAAVVAPLVAPQVLLTLAALHAQVLAQRALTVAVVSMAAVLPFPMLPASAHRGTCSLVH